MDRSKATTQLLGRFHPWHDGHTKIFERALSKTGQVVILLRESDGSESNPLGIKDRIARIRGALSLAGYKYGREYEVIPCLLYTSPSPRDRQKSRMPSSA